MIGEDDDDVPHLYDVLDEACRAHLRDGTPLKPAVLSSLCWAWLDARESVRKRGGQMRRPAAAAEFVEVMLGQKGHVSSNTARFKARQQAVELFKPLSFESVKEAHRRLLRHKMGL
jgi:hypothetical protein